MSDIYLLAISLLTGLAVPSTTPQFLLMKSTRSPEVNTQDVLFRNTINVMKLQEVLQVSPPEFSQSRLSQATDLLTSPEVVASRKVCSGPKMYYQTLAALSAGQIYTRLKTNYWYPAANSRRQYSKLTYTDWKTLLAMEAKAIAEGQGKNRLSILIGDSLSMWFPKEKLPDGQLWLNQGISGDTSTGVLKRLSIFSVTKPQAIYIMAGINDLRRGIKAPTIINNHRLIIRRLRKTHPQTEIIIQSILPTRRADLPNNYIRYINKQLAIASKQEGAKFVKIYNWFTDFQENLRPELTTDGLHLSQEGYDVWRSALK
ncbi:MAG: lipolytic protein G-D-S-L family [Richelia sp.]|nr:lipolytic protein G-D-S-L family [Richelia sp.]